MMRNSTREKNNTYIEDERRDFLRLIYETPLMYKVCKKKTFSRLMRGYTHNISRSGLMCNLKNRVPVDSVIWLQLDMGALSMCEEIEKRCTIIQHGILGMVVWASMKKNKSYDVGVRFIAREEKKSENWIIRESIV